MKVASIGFPSHPPARSGLSLLSPHPKVLALGELFTLSGACGIRLPRLCALPAMFLPSPHVCECVSECVSEKPLPVPVVFLRLSHGALRSQEGLLFMVMICWQFLGSLALRPPEIPLSFLLLCRAAIPTLLSLYSGFVEMRLN